MAASKRDWVLLAFRAGPLDRIHLMEALFLTWNRSERSIPDFFRFEESTSYGPCSQEFYAVLDELCRDGLVVRASDDDAGGAKYCLTMEGKLAAERAAEEAEREALGRLNAIVEEVCTLDAYTLLQKVREETPDDVSEYRHGDIIGPPPDDRSPGERWRSLRF